MKLSYIKQKRKQLQTNSIYKALSSTQYPHYYNAYIYIMDNTDNNRLKTNTHKKYINFRSNILLRKCWKVKHWKWLNINKAPLLTFYSIKSLTCLVFKSIETCKFNLNTHTSQPKYSDYKNTHDVLKINDINTNNTCITQVQLTLWDFNTVKQHKTLIFIRIAKSSHKLVFLREFFYKIAHNIVSLSIFRFVSINSQPEYEGVSKNNIHFIG